MGSSLAGKKIAWAIDMITPGSGGIQTICRHVSHLQSLGAQCDFFIRYYDKRLDRILTEVLEGSYACTGVSLNKWDDLDEGYDVAIATLFTSASIVAQSKCPHKVYFVQDYEPFFVAMGDKWIEADQSYRLGLKPITIGNWLVKKLHDEYGLYPVPTRFGVDDKFYHPLESCEKRRAVCAIFQPDKARRCPELMLNALATLHEMDPDIELLVYGSTENLPRGFEYIENLGLLTKEECNELYNSCLVGLSISASNPSRIPFEMMKAGLPVVDLYGGNTLYDFANDVITLAQPAPEAIAAALSKLVEDQKAREKQRKNALDYCKSRPITIEQEEFAKALQIVISDKEKKKFKEPKPSYTRGALESTAETSAATREAQAKLFARRKIDTEKKIGDQVFQAGLEGESFELSLTNVSPSLGVQEACFYIWREPDQSDLVRARAEFDDEGVLRGNFSLDEEHPSGVYHVHAYCMIDGFEEMAVATVVKLVSTSQDDAEVEPSKANKAIATGELFDFSEILIDIEPSLSFKPRKVPRSKAVRRARHLATKTQAKAARIKRRLFKR